MVMAPATDRWTVEQVDQLPEDANRHEVIHGRLFVTPAPSFVHQFLERSPAHCRYPRDRIEWLPEAGRPPWAVDLVALFARVE
jgi:hypothetical protein